VSKSLLQSALYHILQICRSYRACMQDAAAQINMASHLSVDRAAVHHSRIGERLTSASTYRLIDSFVLQFPFDQDYIVFHHYHVTFHTETRNVWLFIVNCRVFFCSICHVLNHQITSELRHSMKCFIDAVIGYSLK